MMNKKSIFKPFDFLVRKKRNGGIFMSHRITRRDIDNTHRVNGIS